MSFGETIVKIIFWSRIRKAKKIGQAAELIGQGRAEETLDILKKMENRIPPYIGHLFFLTRGRAYDELGQYEEAEKAYIGAVFIKEGATIAHIHLAVLCGRLRRFDEARDWLRRIHEDEEADEDLKDQATDLEGMLDDVESGKRLEEIRTRAKEFASISRLSLKGTDPKLEESLQTVDSWIEKNPELAQKHCDDLACFLGDLIAGSATGDWLVSLNLEDSAIETERGIINPFELVGQSLSEEGQKLTGLVSKEESYAQSSSSSSSSPDSPSME